MTAPTLNSVRAWDSRMARASILALATCLFAPLPAYAAESPAYLAKHADTYESPGRGVAGTVRARPRPDFDAVGMPLGSFRLLPSIAFSTVYDSNVFRTDDGETGDLIGQLQPALRLESDWSQHSIVITGSADLGFYAEEDSENYTDGRTNLAGVIDIQRGLQLETELGFAHLHEPRGSVDGDGGAEPVTFNRSTGQAALAMSSGRFNYRVGGGLALEDYNDVPRSGGGTLNQDDRDQAIWSGFGSVSYEALPGTRAFIASQYKILDFEAAEDDNGINRDSQQQKIVGGIDLDLGGVTFARAYAGWIGQQFDDDELEDISGLTLGGDLTANVTPLTTITAAFGRDVYSTVTDGASAFVESRVQLEVDHELLRNFLLNASVWGRRLTFDGIDRTDDHFGLGLGGEWLLNRYASLRLQYEFDLRNSHGNDSTNDWRRQALALRLVLQR